MRVDVAHDGVIDCGALRLQFHWWIGIRRHHSWHRSRMVGRLRLAELQAMRRRHHHHAVIGLHFTTLNELDQPRQGHAGMRAVEQAGAISSRHGIGQFLLAGLLDLAVVLHHESSVHNHPSQIL